ncbi:MAG: hypothetical protein LUQ35_03465 [Methanoregula sp.]|jgi:hypothetical protein|nr:hypothetical protein [Methanoregula sp.]
MVKPKLLVFEKTFTTDNLGQIFLVPPTKNNIIDFSNVHMEIEQDSHVSNIQKMFVLVAMGKGTGTTLAQEVGRWTLDDSVKIHSFPVIGPEIGIIIKGGPKNTPVGINAWIMFQ